MVDNIRTEIINFYVLQQYFIYTYHKECWWNMIIYCSNITIAL